MARIKQQASDLKDSLARVEARMEVFADEEATKVLAEYEVERESLLSAQAQRVEDIRGDVLRVKELAESLQSDAIYEDKTDRRLNLLSALVALFSIGALSFFVSAVADESAAQMRYAVADMLIAIGIAVYARWSVSGGKEK